MHAVDGADEFLQFDRKTVGRAETSLIRAFSSVLKPELTGKGTLYRMLNVSYAFVS